KEYFNATDVQHMKQESEGDIDLSDYQSVKDHGEEIYDRVSRGDMPPYAPWSQEQVATFHAWMNANYPETGGQLAPQPGTWKSVQQIFQSAVAHMKQVTGGNLDLSDYDNVVRNIASIQKVIDAKTMPPGFRKKISDQPGGLSPDDYKSF